MNHYHDYRKEQLNVERLRIEVDKAKNGIWDIIPDSLYKSYDAAIKQLEAISTQLAELRDIEEAKLNERDRTETK